MLGVGLIAIGGAMVVIDICNSDPEGIANGAKNKWSGPGAPPDIENGGRGPGGTGEAMAPGQIYR